MKKSFSNVLESKTIVGGASEDNIIKITNMLLEKRRQLDLKEAKDEAIRVREHKNEIEKMNASSGQPKIGGFFKRDKILSEIELDYCTEEMSESDNDEEEEGGEENDNTENDAENILNGQLAKKFLGVQASSACVERMFSIAGHIFTNKRRRTGVKLFENLVFMKLNENYL